MANEDSILRKEVLDDLYEYNRLYDELHGKVKRQGVDKDSILEILDDLHEYERSSDELLRQVKKKEVDEDNILEILDGL